MQDNSSIPLGSTIVLHLHVCGSHNAEAIPSTSPDIHYPAIVNMMKPVSECHDSMANNWGLVAESLAFFT